MEKRTTQRIIGILIAIALVIILLPLLFGKKDTGVQSAAVTEPPFPEQVTAPAGSVVAANDQSEMEPPLTENPEVEPSSLETNAQPTPAATEQPTVKTEQQATASPTPEVKSETIATKPSSATTLSQADVAQDIIIKSDKASNPAVMEIKSNTFASHKTKVKHVKEKPSFHAQNKTLPNLKKTAWAVQLGSFKNKNNAQRLADKLRAAGYQAFMREAKSENGSDVQTRVYIGPEYKQASALKLSTELKDQMQLSGLVVAYKPLEL